MAKIKGVLLAVTAMVMGTAVGMENANIVRCPGHPTWWSCPSDLCCARIRQPQPSFAPFHSLCVPCTAFAADTACTSLAALEHRLGHTLQPRLPSLRLYLHQRHDLTLTHVELCHGHACNAPPRHHPASNASIYRPDPNHHGYCWHDSPLNTFFPGNHLKAAPALQHCAPDQHCCATAHLPAGQQWSIGCAHCPLYIEPQPTHSPASDDSPSPWTPDAVICTVPSVSQGPRPVNISERLMPQPLQPPSPLINVSKIVAGVPHTESDRSNASSIDKNHAYSRKPSHLHFTMKKASPTQSPFNATTPVKPSTEKLPSCDQNHCPSPNECCARIGSTGGNKLQFCLPCKIVRETALEGSSSEARTKCGTLGSWQRASLLRLDPYLPSVHSILRASNDTAAVRACYAKGCNRPQAFRDPSPRNLNHLRGPYCWSFGPLSKFFTGNDDGKAAAVSECNPSQACCSYVERGTERWAIGCVGCSHGHADHKFEDDWKNGEISPWTPDMELCGFLKEPAKPTRQPPRPRSQSVPPSLPTTPAETTFVCHAPGIEPHFNWKCPANASCCLTVGSLDNPLLPRLPSCVPCHLTHQPSGYALAGRGKVTCQSIDKWQAAVGSHVLDYVPTLHVFFRHHAWVLEGSTVAICKGDACNVPEGFDVPDHPKDANWCWHHSPMNKFFAGNAGGDKAVLAKCGKRERCCTTISLFNGDAWALGCHDCGSEGARVVSAAEFVGRAKAANLAPSPWESERSEACTWRPTHRCHVFSSPSLSIHDSSATDQDQECPDTHCCYTAMVSGAVVGQGCSPCIYEDRCSSWGSHLAAGFGRRQAGRPFSDHYWPPLQATHGAGQQVCVCRGSLCNKRSKPPSPQPHHHYEPVPSPRPQATTPPPQLQLSTHGPTSPHSNEDQDEQPLWAQLFPNFESLLSQQGSPVASLEEEGVEDGTEDSGIPLSSLEEMWLPEGRDEKEEALSEEMRRTAARLNAVEARLVSKAKVLQDSARRLLLMRPIDEATKKAEDPGTQLAAALSTASLRHASSLLFVLVAFFIQ